MAKKIKVILLFGAPGCGKGTQGRMLGMLPGYVHLACGDVFRGIDQRSELGRIFSEYSTKGLLVPDEFTVRLWREHLNDMVATGRFKPDRDVLVLDGIPRNMQQAKLLKPFMQVIRAVEIRTDRDPEQLVARLRSRALKEGRADDAQEGIIRRRLEVYEKETTPVVGSYPKGIRAEVNGLQSPMEVARDIVCGILGCMLPSEAGCRRTDAIWRGCPRSGGKKKA